MLAPDPRAAFVERPSVVPVIVPLEAVGLITRQLLATCSTMVRTSVRGRPCR